MLWELLLNLSKDIYEPTNGNHYDHVRVYESKYAEPDLDANELQSLESGSLYISITTAGTRKIHR